jgi:hypothetical protein
LPGRSDRDRALLGTISATRKHFGYSERSEESAFPKRLRFVVADP